MAQMAIIGIPKKNLIHYFNCNLCIYTFFSFYIIQIYENIWLQILNILHKIFDL